MSGYVLGYGGLLLLGGRAADLLGRKRVLIAGLSVFIVASAVGGLVNDGTLLVVTRVLKGMSAAFTAPAGLLALLALWADGGGRVLPLDAWGATAVSTVLVYVQRGVGLCCAPRSFRPLLRHFVLEPALSSLVGTVCFACALRDLLLDAVRGSPGRIRRPGWRAGE